MRYEVTIQETLERKIQVDADSPAAARYRTMGEVVWQASHSEAPRSVGPTDSGKHSAWSMDT